MISRRRLLTGFAYASIVGSSTLDMLIARASANEMRTRKNIDALTSQEVADYAHAISILKERSKVDPNDQAGYDYQAALHNADRTHPDGTIGSCEHGSEEFLPWHRIHLLLFEDLLRAADPPRTSNVTLPYWNWHEAASGKRFPIAFEDAASSLFHAGRWGNDFGPARWDAADIGLAIREDDWNLFAGDAKPQPSYGYLENHAHNEMHGLIGPTMGDPSSAAEDPIFWSFHTFIDLIWARWQRLNTQTVQNGAAVVWVEPESRTVDQMIVKTSALGYQYDFDFEADGVAEVKVAGGRNRIPLSVERASDRAMTVGLPATSRQGARRLLKLAAVTPSPDFSFEILVFVHPSGFDPLAGSPSSARDDFLIDRLVIWRGRSGHTHHGGSNAYVDLVKANGRDLIAGWQITVATSALPLVPPGERVTMMDAANNRLAPISSLIQALEVEER